jgi:hypothetical protein
MKRIILLIAGICAITSAAAQVQVGEGQVSGSLESNTIYYTDDSKIGETPEDRFGSNNYLKVDYSNGRF